MTTWIVSDWHLGEDRLEIMNRPFSHGLQMIKRMMDLHNEMVSPDDEVIVVGDVCYQKRTDYLHFAKHFNGRKTLIRGNHDRGLTDEQLAPYFHTIIPDGDGLEIDVDGLPCYAVHYPTRGRQDRFNLVGHVHSAWKYQLNMYNVGVDTNHFRPFRLDRVPAMLKSICEYYDQDVWVAYHEANSSFVNLRGKPGSYFK